jgi:hypothetical protein
MSITNDIRSYADTALEQGKQVLDQAQTQISGVTGQANEFVGKVRGTAVDNVSGLSTKALDAVSDLRAQAEKAVNLDAIKAAIEPYLAQAKGYSSTVTDRAEDLFTTVTSDKRVAVVVSKAEAFTETVLETVQVRIVKPVQSLTGRGTKPASKPAAPKAAVTKPAVTKPAVTKPATTASARKAPAKKITTAG